MSWVNELKSAITSPKELLEFLNLTYDSNKVIENHHFKMKVPYSYARRMAKGDWNDPLLNQVLLRPEEEDAVLGVEDPLREKDFIFSKGVLQKFSSRVLFIGSSHCAVHCRYCFRKHFPYDDQRVSKKEWKDNIKKLLSSQEVKEVILSGGDPLSLKDNFLSEIFQDLQELNQLDSIRIHTRFPVVIPSRLTSELLSIFTRSKIPVVLVLHINHAQELDQELIQRLQDYRQSGIFIFNQAVLLKGVNDNLLALKNLSTKCFASGVLPYYLHQMDEVKSAMHYWVDPRKGLELMKALRSELPGYLIPQYVKEVPGALSKIPVHEWLDSR